MITLRRARPGRRPAPIRAAAAIGHAVLSARPRGPGASPAAMSRARAPTASTTEGMRAAGPGRRAEWLEPALRRPVDALDGVVGREQHHAQAGVPRVAGRRREQDRRRRPSARSRQTEATSRASARVNAARLSSRIITSPPHVPVWPASAARSSSPRPCGRRSSRCRRLRSSAPSVASLRIATDGCRRASSVNLLTSGSATSISSRRRVAAPSGSPPSITCPVGSIVAGSKVTTQSPSNGTTGRSRRPTASAKSCTSSPR